MTDLREQIAARINDAAMKRSIREGWRNASVGGIAELSIETADDILEVIRGAVPVWQPIETAPKDALILGYEGGMIRLVLWENGWTQVGASIEKGWFEPTHWMHLSNTKPNGSQQ